MKLSLAAATLQVPYCSGSLVSGSKHPSYHVKQTPTSHVVIEDLSPGASPALQVEARTKEVSSGEGGGGVLSAGANAVLLNNERVDEGIILQWKDDGVGSCGQVSHSIEQLLSPMHNSL